MIRRADGSWLYLLTSVIDDIDLRITHIVRGEDHVSNSAVQLQMFAAMGAEPPQLAHEALLVAAEGKLSKRLGAVGVGAMAAILGADLATIEQACSDRVGEIQNPRCHQR